MVAPLQFLIFLCSCTQGPEYHLTRIHECIVVAMCPLRHPYSYSDTHLHQLTMYNSAFLYSPDYLIVTFEVCTKLLFRLQITTSDHLMGQEYHCLHHVSFRSRMSLFVLLQYTHPQMVIIVCVSVRFQDTYICMSLGNTCTASLSLCHKITLICVVNMR